MHARVLAKIVVFTVVGLFVSVFVGSCKSQGNQLNPGRYEMWCFDKDKGGAVPKGWVVSETSGRGKKARWQVVSDRTAPSGGKVVAITANENSGHTYNLLTAEGTKYKDLEIRVMVKAVAGKEDQGGGPIWRAKDSENYYIARWNPLEDNFRVYFVKEGKRQQLGSADVKTDRSGWHEISITHRDTRIVASLDGSELIEVEDSTFSEGGQVGLWVKADGETAFDTVSVVKLFGFGSP
ncbi:MAG: hypothetical protein JW720_01795 [Sedimentisphaerales bacterium]|nr:hypothetical protein [Sedimentisphaerales bacterium]